MKKPIIAGAVIFAAVTAFLVWWFSDTQVIKRRTSLLAETLTISEPDSNPARALKSQKFAELLAKNFSGNADLARYSGNISRDEAISGHQYLSHSVKSSSLTLSDFKIISLESSTAQVSATFSLSITTKNGETDSETSATSLVWIKNDSGKWQLSSATLEPRP